MGGGGLSPVIYYSKQSSGPSFQAGYQNPLLDVTETYWSKLIDNGGVVHKSGDETIDGKKTFRGGFHWEGSSINHTELILSAPETSLVDDQELKSEACFTSIQFIDKHDYLNTSENVGIGYIDVRAPYGSDDSFSAAFGLRTIPSYAGKNYGASCALRIYSKPNGVAYADYWNLAIHGNGPRLALSSTAVEYGTAPSSNKWFNIYFCDKDIGSVFTNASNVYAFIGACVENDGGTRFRVWAKTTSGGNYGQIDLKSFESGTNTFFPTTSGSVQIGDGSHRWGQLFTTTAPNVSSDARIKSEIKSIPDSILDAWEDVNFVQFKLNDSISKKGFENARVHSGVIAQDVKIAFQKHNVNAHDYGFFCWDLWDAELEDRDEETGRINTPKMDAGDLYSIRYEEALCMEAAYQRRENRRLKEKVASLEERLASLEEKLK